MRRLFDSLVMVTPNDEVMAPVVPVENEGLNNALKLIASAICKSFIALELSRVIGRTQILSFPQKAEFEGVTYGAIYFFNEEDFSKAELTASLMSEAFRDCGIPSVVSGGNYLLFHVTDWDKLIWIRQEEFDNYLALYPIKTTFQSLKKDFITCSYLKNSDIEKDSKDEKHSYFYTDLLDHYALKMAINDMLKHFNIRIIYPSQANMTRMIDESLKSICKKNHTAEKDTIFILGCNLSTLNTYLAEASLLLLEYYDFHLSTFTGGKVDLLIPPIPIQYSTVKYNFFETLTIKCKLSAKHLKRVRNKLITEVNVQDSDIIIQNGYLEITPSRQLFEKFPPTGHFLTEEKLFTEAMQHVNNPSMFQSPYLFWKDNSPWQISNKDYPLAPQNNISHVPTLSHDE